MVDSRAIDWVESLFDEIIDSTHAIADVNPGKDNQRRETQGKPPRDPDAAWGTKRIKQIKDKDGNARNIPETFYGYKIHASFNPETDLITRLLSNTDRRLSVCSARPNSTTG